MAIVNDRELVPTTVSSGPFTYPGDIIDHLEAHMPVILIDCITAAKEVGNVRAANTVLLGALSIKLDISKDIWRAAIYRSVPPGTEKINSLAFGAGRRLARKLAPSKD